MKNNTLPKRALHKKRVIKWGLWGLCVGALLFPEWVFAVKLEEQLDTVGTLATTKVKTIGVAGASICGAIWSLFKGNITLAGTIIFIGVSLAMYLNWVSAGMQF